MKNKEGLGNILYQVPYEYVVHQMKSNHEIVCSNSIRVYVVMVTTSKLTINHHFSKAIKAVATIV